MNEARKTMWRMIRAIFDMAWKDHRLDPHHVRFLEDLGLAQHPDQAVLLTAKLLAQRETFPPGPAAWFKLLEGHKPRKEVTYWKDCWGRTILGDGGPKIRSFEEVYDPPEIYQTLSLPCPVGPRGLPAARIDADEENRALVSPMQRYLNSGADLSEADYEYLEREHEPEP